MALFDFKSKEEKDRLSVIDSNYAVISFTPDGTILGANKNFLDALGYGLNEIVGKHHKIFCDNTYVNSRDYSDFWSNLKKGITQTSEFKRIKRNGESIFIQASYSPVIENGAVTKVIKFAQDITQKKLENLYLKGQIDAISKSQAVIEFNMDGTIVNANDNFLNTVGYSLSEIVGRHHSIFCEDSYKNSSEYQNFWRKLNDGQFDSGEYLRIGKNGKKVWIQASYNPIFDLDNKPMRVVKYATDITNKKNMQFEIAENTQKLTQSLNSLSTASESMLGDAKVTMRGSQDVTVSIEQINQAVSNLSEKIESMLSSITGIAKEANHGEEIAKEAREQSKSTSSSIIRLNEESTKIGATINLITQIAFQTNILSLNAAVEAATAGEAGKGFAVVAQEVRNLATRSNEAAKEITNAIQSIQTLVSTSLDSINSIDATIEEITTMSSKISNSMMDQQTISNDLASSALETSRGIDEITQTMVRVSQTAQNTEREAEQTVNASENLIQVSSEMINILKKLN